MSTVHATAASNKAANTLKRRREAKKRVPKIAHGHQILSSSSP